MIYRYYNLTEQLKHIKIKGSYICFGKDFDIKLDQDRRTNFKIFGTPYSCGMQDYYTVDAVVYFLLQVVPLTTYEEYLKLALINNKQVVRQPDFVNLHKYLHGEIDLCDEIDPSFTDEETRELNFLFLKTRQIDADLNLPNIKTQLKEELKEEEKIELEKSKLTAESEQEFAHDNPNRIVVSKLKEHLLNTWNMKLDQATDRIELLVATLKSVGYTMSQVRIDYFGVPKHRELYLNIMRSKLETGLREQDIGGVKNAAENMKLTLQAGLRSPTRFLLGFFFKAQIRIWSKIPLQFLLIM
mgnify:CR=1 FL=1